MNNQKFVNVQMILKENHTLMTKFEISLFYRNNNDDNLEEETAVYTIKGSDQQWLDTILEQDTDWEVVTLTIDNYINDVCEKKNFSKILYSNINHHEVTPQIITLAG